jgi:hypothetical protein
MALFNSPLPKAPGPVRTAFASLISKIRNTIETTEVYNYDEGNAYPIGTVMSYVQDDGSGSGVTDQKGQVAPTTNDPGLPPEQSCKEQYVGVLEAALAVAPATGEAAVATARHAGGPVYVRLVTGLDLHVGDALYASQSAPTRGMATNVVGLPNDIYVGMVDSIVGYVPADPDGTSGCMAILKHDAPLLVP